MRNTISCLAVFIMIAAAFPGTSWPGERTTPLVIDRTCTDLSKIPGLVVDEVQQNNKWHFARMSRGRQINDGLQLIEDADPAYSVIWPKSGGELLYEEGAFSIYKSPSGPYDYWQGTGIDKTRTVLDETPELAGDDIDHTSYDNCELKGKAAWWLMAAIQEILPGRTYIYRIGAVSGEREFTSFELKVFAVNRMEPDLMNYPNPCNPCTSISFVLETPSCARLDVFDAAGRRISTLANGQFGMGRHSMAWDGTNDKGENVNSGVYFYRLDAGKESRTNKLLLLR